MVSYKDPKKTSLEDQTTKQTVAASPENEELNALGEPEAKVPQSEVTGLTDENKANSAVGNQSAGQEVSSAKCSIKVVNKEWKSHLDQTVGKSWWKLGKMAKCCGKGVFSGISQESFGEESKAVV